MSRKNTTKNTKLRLLGPSLLVVVLAMGLALSFASPAAALEPPPYAEIEFGEQETDGHSVVVAYALLEYSGYVGVQSEEGELIGISRFIEYDAMNIRIDLDPPLNRSQVLTAQGYHDEGGNSDWGYEEYPAQAHVTVVEPEGSGQTEASPFGPVLLIVVAAGLVVHLARRRR